MKACCLCQTNTVNSQNAAIDRTADVLFLLESNLRAFFTEVLHNGLDWGSSIVKKLRCGPIINPLLRKCPFLLYRLVM